MKHLLLFILFCHTKFFKSREKNTFFFEISTRFTFNVNEDFTFDPDDDELRSFGSILTTRDRIYVW